MKGRRKLNYSYTSHQWRTQVLKITGMLWRLTFGSSVTLDLEFPDFASNSPFLSSFGHPHSSLCTSCLPLGKPYSRHLTYGPQPPTCPSDSWTLMLRSYTSTATALLKLPTHWPHYFLFFISPLMRKPSLHSSFRLEFISHRCNLSD